MSQSPNSDSNPQTQQTHSGRGDNVVGNKDETNTYYSEIGGDFKGIQGDIWGGVINQYIITRKSKIEITQRDLIQGSPYKGLEKFRVEDNDKFFGREDWTIRLTDYVKENAVLLLLGASGSGKSSLIQAGVIPQLMDDLGSNTLVNLTFVPDVNPFESLYGCLISPYGLSNAKKAQTEAEDTLIKVVDELKEDNKIWLIFIDQFEELFTRTPKATRDIFIKALNQLIQRRETKVKIVLTMRADFLDKFHDYPVLGKVHDNSSLMLTEIEERGVRLAIAEPAARNGVIFEKGLVEQIISDFQFKDEDKTGALPLLEYTLDLLWQKSLLDNRILTLETYNEIGGVKGALKLQANKVYDDLLADEQEIVKQILVELIALEGKEAVSRRERKENFERDDKQAEVLKKLIDERLLISQGEGRDATVEVAHEELLRSWDVIINLIEEKRELINLRNRLSADAEQWYKIKQQSPQKAKSELWGGTKLSRIIEFQEEGLLPNLDTIGREFIAASLREETLRQNAKIRTAQTITGISLVGLLISGVLGWTALQKTKEAELNLANSLARNAVSRWNEGDKDLDTLLMAIKAGRFSQKHNINDPEVNDALYKTLLETWEINRLQGHQSAISSVSFSADGQILASSGNWDRTINLWDVKTGKLIHTLIHDLKGDLGTFGNFWNKKFGNYNYAIRNISFSPDNQTLASGLGNGIIKIWDVKKGKLIHNINGKLHDVKSVVFSPDGSMLASGDTYSTVRLWNVKTGSLIRIFKGHNDSVSSVSFNHDGTILASGSWDKNIKLWNVKTGKVMRTLQGHDGWVETVTFNHDGTILASGSNDNTIKLWDVKTGKVIRTIEGHSSFSDVSFNDDGSILASGSDDNIIKLWDMKTGKVIRTLVGHNDSVESVSFNPEGTILASGSSDDTIKLWDVKTGKVIRTLAGHNDSVESVSFNHDGTILASGNWDKTIKFWDVKTGKVINTNTFKSEAITFNSDSSILAAEGDDNIIQLWDIKTGKIIRFLKGHNDTITSMSFNKDGSILASSSEDGTIRLWYRLSGWSLDELIEEGCDKVRNYLMYNPTVSKEDKKLCQ
ncbi:MAG: hypothetical protein AB4041_11135 [Microcystaceae cyanobacterium]